MTEKFEKQKVNTKYDNSIIRVKWEIIQNLIAKLEKQRKIQNIIAKLEKLRTKILKWYAKYNKIEKETKEIQNMIVKLEKIWQKYKLW